MFKASPIKVRRVRFEYPDDIRALWNPPKPELSQMVNAASLLMPYLEPYLVNSVRAAIPQLPTDEHKQEAKGYIGQEANHHRQHRRFNDLLLAQGYAAVRENEQKMQSDYQAFKEQRDQRFHLAYAAGFETMALAIGHMLFKHRGWFFKDADPAVSALVLWHFVEELEHKNSAFVVYQSMYGQGVRGYLYRVYATLYCVFQAVGRTAQAYLHLRRIDRAQGKPMSRWRGKLAALKILCWSAPTLLHGLLPWHKPADFKDPEWVSKWIELYDSQGDELALLDTAKIDHPHPVPAT